MQYQTSLALMYGNIMLRWANTIACLRLLNRQRPERWILIVILNTIILSMAIIMKFHVNARVLKSALPTMATPIMRWMATIIPSITSWFMTQTYPTKFWTNVCVTTQWLLCRNWWPTTSVIRRHEEITIFLLCLLRTLPILMRRSAQWSRGAKAGSIGKAMSWFSTGRSILPLNYFPFHTKEPMKYE